ncbi:hypothetical protein Tco_1062827, partial [Tanacetum coccineum]
MESSKDQNKGDGFIGSFDVDGIHSRMNRLKEVDAGRNSNPDVNLRKPIRGLQNPNALFEGSSAFAEGDLIGVSSHTGRISKETMNVVLTDGVPLNTLGDIDNLTKAIDLGKLEVWSTLPSEKRTE